MRTKIAFAAFVLSITSLIPASPVQAETGDRAQLQVVVVDQVNVGLPAATVTIFTLDGNPGITVKADKKGVVSFPKLPVGLAQIRVVSPGLAPYIEAITLTGGATTQTVTLKPRTT